MTQPIQEPTTQRAIAGSQWGISQLARRPAPVVAAATGPYAVIVYTAGETIANDTPTNLSALADFVDCYVSDTDLLDTDLSLGRIIFKLTGSNLKAPGQWLGCLQIDWQNHFTGEMFCALNWQVGTFEAVEQRTFNDKGEGPTNPLTTGETNVASTVQLLQTNNIGHNNWLTGVFKQMSGVSQDLTQITLSATRLSEYPGPNGAFC